MLRKQDLQDVVVVALVSIVAEITLTYGEGGLVARLFMPVLMIAVWVPLRYMNPAPLGQITQDLVVLVLITAVAAISINHADTTVAKFFPQSLLLGTWLLIRFGFKMPTPALN